MYFLVLIFFAFIGSDAPGKANSNFTTNHKSLADTIPTAEQVRIINQAQMPPVRDPSMTFIDRSIQNHGITPIENGTVTISISRKGKLIRTDIAPRPNVMEIGNILLC